MSYKLEKELPLKKNISLVAAEEIDACLDALETMNSHEAVHEIRKRLKKLRALARLVRDEMGEENYKSINIFFRDLGRELSDFRDLTANLESIELLRQRYGDHLYVKFFNSVIKKIEAERNSMEKELKARNFFSEHLVQQLQHARKDLVKWPVDSDDISIILPGMERVYKRGKRALKSSYKKQKNKKFHEWRKRVKYLWYQTLLLQDTWPQFFESLEAELHELSDYLGIDHDLMVLKDKIEKDDLIREDNNQKELFIAIISEFSRFLRNNAKTKGELIYAEKPKDFSKRIGAYTKVNWN